jgi:hypothetical protein
MRKGKRQPKGGAQKVRRLPSEKYAPVEEWGEAPTTFQKLLLRDGEFTTIVDPHTGMGLYLLACLRNTIRCHAYLDGERFKEDFKRVTFLELNERAKENEKFL